MKRIKKWMGRIIENLEKIVNKIAVVFKMKGVKKWMGKIIEDPEKTVNKIVFVLGVLIIVVLSILWVSSGIFGKIAVIISAWILYRGIKNGFYYSHKNPTTMPYFVSKITGEIRAGKMGLNKKFPLLEVMDETEIKRKTLEISVHSTTRRTEVNFTLLIAFVPDKDNLLTYLRAGNVEQQIEARAEDVLNREAGRLSLEKILTEKKEDLKKIVELELIQGPLRAVYQKIFIVGKEIERLEKEKEIVGDPREKEQIKREIEASRNYLFRQLQEYENMLRSCLITEEELKIAQEKGELETFLSILKDPEIEKVKDEIRTQLTQIEKIVKDLKIEEEVGWKKAEEEYLIPKISEGKISLEKEKVKEYPLKTRVERIGFKPKIVEMLKQSSLEKDLGIILSAPDIREYQPDEETRRARIQELNADYQTKRLNWFAQQKRRIIRDWKREGISPDRGLDAILIDANKNVSKKVIEIPAIERVAEAVIRAITRQRRR
ncbi:hypothetical protein J7K44_00140 [bacterium]|nr:hypothetical protein [bacterium]